MNTFTKWFLLNAVMGTALFFAEQKNALSTIVKNYGIKPSLFFTKPFEKAFTNLPKELQEQFAKDLENLI